ncbi:MAG: HlyC/CorC family transporter [Turicibacter sp.]|uniref:Hemolysin n=2 Tax=Turicibacter TaxID=191303 RepID=A0ABN6Z8E6_9FIRM|nr:hemolysin family protein [Turicibacter sp. 1E2]MCI8702651.1 HlyC/CorC family transporter [Turicibacter sp.]MCU7210226.1 hemolysin family protein [Turicibacter sp. 1E2]NCE78832.1 HlyC/CorC family transporter [Turicibacter sp. TS3]BEH90122.1 hemolysin [Turicibacter sp. TC023]
MDPSMYYVILVIMIILSAFFSASETAFSSVNLIRLRQYVDDGRPGAKKALNVAERFDEVLLAILIGNNIVNLASASLATIVATEVLNLGASGAPIATAVMTVLIIIFGEILPKSYAKENSESLALSIGTIYYYMIKVMKPLIFIFMVLKDFVAKLYSKKEDEPSVTEDELNVIIDTMEEEGVLQQDEVEMLQSVLDLSETFVKDIMTPRVDVVAVDVHDSTENVKNVFFEEKYSRIPVYDESRDNIVGILYERDLFSAIIENGSTDDLLIADVMRDPMYVSYTMRVSDLLTRLQLEKQHLAIVADEYGGTAGLVTMEDVLEEVVGEIYDEHDEEEQLVVKKSDTLYEVKAEIELDELFDIMDIDLDIPEDAYSLGSWMYSKIEDIPEIGDMYQYHNLIFTIIEVEDRRIIRVKIEVVEPENAPEE